MRELSECSSDASRPSLPTRVYAAGPDGSAQLDPSLGETHTHAQIRSAWAVVAAEVSEEAGRSDAASVSHTSLPAPPSPPSAATLRRVRSREGSNASTLRGAASAPPSPPASLSFAHSSASRSSTSSREHARGLPPTFVDPGLPNDRVLRRIQSRLDRRLSTELSRSALAPRAASPPPSPPEEEEEEGAAMAERPWPTPPPPPLPPADVGTGSEERSIRLNRRLSRRWYEAGTPIY